MLLKKIEFISRLTRGGLISGVGAYTACIFCYIPWCMKLLYCSLPESKNTNTTNFSCMGNKVHPSNVKDLSAEDHTNKLSVKELRHYHNKETP